MSKIKRSNKLLAVFAVVLIAVSPVWSQQKGMQVLMIGDSNTEHGNITMGLKDILDSIYGDYGSGFCTLNPNSTGRMPDSIAISCDSNWNFSDMRNDFTPAPGTYYSPNGLSISSAIAGAETVVHFPGDAIDLYYLQSQQPGQFSVMIDGKQKETIKQDTGACQTKKITFENIGPGNHIMTIKVISGDVMLIGVDAKKMSLKNDQRFIVHKWGNAWASSEDYLHIDEEVLSSALKELHPNKIVVLLGTNDYNLDQRSAADFKSNIKALIVRIKKALPHAPVLIISPFNTDGDLSKTILPTYLATSLPEAAKETGSFYWDMNNWFGPYDLQKLPDGVHVNAVYGKRIAEELFKQLRLIFDLR